MASKCTLQSDAMWCHISLASEQCMTQPGQNIRFGEDACWIFFFLATYTYSRNYKSDIVIEPKFNLSPQSSTTPSSKYWLDLLKRSMLSITKSLSEALNMSEKIYIRNNIDSRHDYSKTYLI